MAVPEDGGVALLPIKPEFAGAILAGTKRVEFRKTRFRRDVTHVVIYASTPVQRVVGWFRVGNVDSGSPAEIWSKHERHGGISADRFDEYYRQHHSAVAIGVADVRVLGVPLPLSALGVMVPQNFRYLTASEVRRLNEAVEPPRAVTLGATRRRRRKVAKPRHAMAVSPACG